MRICDKEEGRGERVVQPGDVVWLQYEGRRASDDQLFESTSCARLPTFLGSLLALYALVVSSWMPRSSVSAWSKQHAIAPG